MNDDLPEFWSFNRSRDESLIRTEDLQWRGPFSWIGFGQNNKLQPTPNVSGVYLFTFEYCLFHPKSIPVFQSKSIPF
jgi:hypothetical protein